MRSACPVHGFILLYAAHQRGLGRLPQYAHHLAGIRHVSAEPKELYPVRQREYLRLVVKPQSYCGEACLNLPPQLFQKSFVTMNDIEVIHISAVIPAAVNLFYAVVDFT